jgi:hypothetical protein
MWGYDMETAVQTAVTERLPPDCKRSVAASPEGPDWEGAYGPPGAMHATRDRGTLTGFMVACPGCGVRSWLAASETVKPSDRPSWLVAAGSCEDVTTLTLAPAINCLLCGWNGHLCKGEFLCC